MLRLHRPLLEAQMSQAHSGTKAAHSLYQEENEFICAENERISHSWHAVPATVPALVLAPARPAAPGPRAARARAMRCQAVSSHQQHGIAEITSQGQSLRQNPHGGRSLTERPLQLPLKTALALIVPSKSASGVLQS